MRREKCHTDQRGHKSRDKASDSRQRLTRMSQLRGTSRRERGGDSDQFLEENSDGSIRPVVWGPLLFIGSVGRKAEWGLETMCTGQM